MEIMAYEDESRKLSDEQEQEILKEAKDRWEICDNYYSDLYKEARDDWHFTHGQGQWDNGAKDVRSKDGRPCLTLNQCLPYAHQITNDIKQARLAIRVVPIDSKADVDTAEVRAGVIRNIEKQSRAKSVYGTAAMNAVGAGIGWMRVDIDYASNDSFDQEVYIRRVLDFESVMIDPTDTSLDGSGADYGFDSSELVYSKEKFEELYPDMAAVSFEGLNNTSSEEDEVSLIRYYYKEFEKKTIYEIKILELDQTGIVDSEDLKKLDDKDISYEKIRSREVDDYKIYHCILSGTDVLSREEFPCQYIPLVPVIGEEYFNDNKREFHSLIRQGKDAQRMYNYLKSENVQIMALQPKAPYIGAVGQFVSQEPKWRTANNQNYSTLEYDMVIDEQTGVMAPPPARQPPPQGSPAMMQEAEAARNDIRLALGVSSANMGERSNIVSGIALRTNQIEGDNATFHFIDNLSSSISQVGRICNDLIPVIYSERTIARIIGENGDEENISVNTPYVKDDNGIRQARGGESPHGTYDLSVGKYDVDLDVGASYSSKRQETADKLIEVAKVKPEIFDVAADILFDVLDVPMAKEISDRIKTTMPAEMLGDDPMAGKLQQAEQAMKQMQEQLLNMEAALADKAKNREFEQVSKTAELQLKRDELAMNVQKTQADIAKIHADIRKEDAETVGQAQENAAQMQK